MLFNAFHVHPTKNPEAGEFLLVKQRTCNKNDIQSPLRKMYQTSTSCCNEIALACAYTIIALLV